MGSPRTERPWTAAEEAGEGMKWNWAAPGRKADRGRRGRTAAAAEVLRRGAAGGRR